VSASAKPYAWLFAAVLALGVADTAAAAADPKKVLRVSTADIDTLDPHQYADSPSFDVLTAIFEGLYQWDYLARPVKLAPVAAVALPEITDGGKTWTIRMRSGIYFTDDASFGGKRRELTAADAVYSLKRWLDPNLRRGGAPIETDLLVGARAVVDAAKRPGASFDYDVPIAGIRALDRYTVQLKLTEPNYPNIENYLTTGMIAREIVEAAGADIRTRAVGTGPYRLKEWKRGSRIVLEANPGYPPVQFPETDDSALAARFRDMRGKTLPQIGVIEISVIEEEVTRLLEFDRGKLDYVALRGEIANRLLDNGKLKPDYAGRGVQRLVFAEPFLFAVYLNIADPTLGGMSNERVALRRAIALAFDVETLVKVVYAGNAIPANQLVPPPVAGHDPAFPPRPPIDRAAANGLLDRFHYDKRDPDGYRRAPDGKPLTITVSLRTGAVSREIQTQWKKDMDAVGVRVDFRLMPFQDLIKELENGKLQIYMGGYGGIPSGYAQLMQLYSKEPPTINVSRFKQDDYDRAMEEYLKSPTVSEQVAASRRMSQIARTYAPMIPTVFRLENDFVQPWLLGFNPQMFQTYWKYMDIDVARKEKGQGR